MSAERRTCRFPRHRATSRRVRGPAAACCALAMLCVALVPQGGRAQAPAAPGTASAGQAGVVDGRAPLPEYPQQVTINPVGFRHGPCAPPPCPQPIAPPLPAQIFGIHCDLCQNCGEQSWRAMGPIPWGVLAQGEYIGPARLAHVPIYRLRVDDNIDFVYLLTRQQTKQAYRLGIGDQIRVESSSTPTLNQPDVVAPPDVIGLIIQPDGTVSLKLLGSVRVAGMTVDQVRRLLEDEYKKFVREPGITIVPYTFNLKLKDIRDSVDRRFGAGGQSQPARVTPEGTVQLPGIGSVMCQGLSIDELKREVDRRYEEAFGEGLEVTPILTARAPRYVYVVGEVATPGRFTLEAPTTLMQAISLAGGWNVGANLNHVVVFRRDDNWRLMATRLDIRGALYGKRPCPSDEIWLRDSDIVLVPKSPILVVDDAISLLFTRGIYSIVPVNYSILFTKLSSI